MLSKLFNIHLQKIYYQIQFFGYLKIFEKVIVLVWRKLFETKIKNRKR